MLTSCITLGEGLHSGGDVGAGGYSGASVGRGGRSMLVVVISVGELLRLDLDHPRGTGTEEKKHQ